MTWAPKLMDQVTWSRGALTGPAWTLGELRRLWRVFLAGPDLTEMLTVSLWPLH